MTQRKLMIFVTEVQGDSLAEDGPAIRWELFPYDFKAVERSLDLLLPSSEKFVDEQYLLEEAEDHLVPQSALGGVQ